MNSRLRRLRPPKSFYIVLALLMISLVSSSCRADQSLNGSDPAGTQTEREKVGSDTPEAGNTAADPASVPDAAAPVYVSEDSAEISEKYGVRILTGSDVPQIYTDYTAACLDDPEKIAAALDELDRTLSIYPPGFFTSVREGYCDSITICLAQDLHAINDDTHLGSAHAFTTVQDDTIWLVLNADRPLRRGTLVHEITHVVDYRLLGMHQLLEAEWNRLNPPSFSYYNSYLDDEGTDLRISDSKEYTSFAEEDAARIWFYDPYSKTFAMEDRARLMEKLLENIVLPGDADPSEAVSSGNLYSENLSPETLSSENLPSESTDNGEGASPRGPSDSDMNASDFADRCFSSPHIQAKLRFYFYTLRQAFENARWPEETVWESALRNTCPQKDAD